MVLYLSFCLSVLVHLVAMASFGLFQYRTEWDLCGQRAGFDCLVCLCGMFHVVLCVCRLYDIILI